MNYLQRQKRKRRRLVLKRVKQAENGHVNGTKSVETLKEEVTDDGISDEELKAAFRASWEANKAVYLALKDR